MTKVGNKYYNKIYNLSQNSGISNTTTYCSSEYNWFGHWGGSELFQVFSYSWKLDYMPYHCYGSFFCIYAVVEFDSQKVFVKDVNVTTNYGLSGNFVSLLCGLFDGCLKRWQWFQQQSLTFPILTEGWVTQPRMSSLRPNWIPLQNKFPRATNRLSRSSNSQ